MAGTGYLWYFSGMTERQALQFQREFFARIGGGLQLAELFESLPMVAFFAKDERSRFVRANARTLQILIGICFLNATRFNNRLLQHH